MTLYKPFTKNSCPFTSILINAILNLIFFTVFNLIKASVIEIFFLNLKS